MHAHKNRDVWDVIESGVGARDNPVLWGITTAGDGSPESIYAELKKRTEDVLTGTVQDDTWFGVIFTLDEGDSWQDERVWPKANPNLGVSVKIESLRSMAQKAKESPASVANFRRKRMNEDVGTASLWLPTEEGSKWQACAGGDFYDGHGLTPAAIQRFRGRKCFVGGDLSSLSDLTALCFRLPRGPRVFGPAGLLLVPAAKRPGPHPRSSRALHDLGRYGPADAHRGRLGEL